MTTLSKKEMEAAKIDMEIDPDGLATTDPGAKNDQGKLRAGLVLAGFSRALVEVCKVGTEGANKYSPNGWMKVKNGIQRYEDAQQRHALKRWSGEKIDPDFGLHHAAHEAWNALAKLELMLREEEKGDSLE
jgi:hypothetical protein